MASTKLYPSTVSPSLPLPSSLIQKVQRPICWYPIATVLTSSILLEEFLLYNYCVMCECRHACTTAHRWSKDSYRKLVLYFQPGYLGRNSGCQACERSTLPLIYTAKMIPPLPPPTAHNSIALSTSVPSVFILNFMSITKIYSLLSFPCNCLQKFNPRANPAICLLLVHLYWRLSDEDGAVRTPDYGIEKQSYNSLALVSV